MDKLLNHQADKIERILAAQGLDIRVVGGTVGPRLIVFHAVKPAAVKLSAVMRMDEEIALGLGAPTCRIGRNGRHLTIEIPRRDPATVHLLSLVPSMSSVQALSSAEGPAPKLPQRHTVTPVLGVDQEGTLLLLRLPSPDVAHVLICGTTGSGKTELARVMIASLAMHNAVHELGLILIDPKHRGYAPFAGLPHLVCSVIHDPDAALGTLAWLVEEMERRDQAGRNTPRLVVFIDELADLMLATQGDLEHVLTRLTQRGRQAGVHIVACTQKPTTAVIGSLIKSNFPVRVVGSVPDASTAAVAAGVSGTGAERLLGRGDFLVIARGQVTRMQAAYVSEAEIVQVVSRLRGRRPLPDQSCREGEAGGVERVDEGSRSSREKIVDFVKRYRSNGHNGAGPGRPREAPTDEMIQFAYQALQANGEVSQRAVQRFHKERYGVGCNTRRARATIEAAEERLARRDETESQTRSR